MRVIIFIFLCLWVNKSAIALNFSDFYQLKKQTKEKVDTTNNQNNGIFLLSQKNKDFFLNQNQHIKNINKYKEIINIFPRLHVNMEQQIDILKNFNRYINKSHYGNENQEILQTMIQLMEEGHQFQKEKDKIAEISNSLSQLPQKITEINHYIYTYKNPETEELLIRNKNQHNYQKNINQQEIINEELYADELELEQISANNRQELARLRSKIHHIKVIYLKNHLHQLRNNLKNTYQIKSLTEIRKITKHDKLKKSILNYIRLNQDFSIALADQIKLICQTSDKQKLINNQINKIKYLNSMLNEQSNGLNYSILLSETLRLRIAKLPEMPQLNTIEQNITRTRLQRLHYEYLIKNKENLIKKERRNILNTTSIIASDDFLRKQILIKHELINLLISGCDSLIIENTKLKTSTIKLQDALRKVKKLSQEHLFWIADTYPIGFNNIIDIIRDIKYLLSLGILTHIREGVLNTFLHLNTVLPIIGALLLVILSFALRHKCDDFLEHYAAKVGKVTQDRFILTIRVVILSLLMAMALPLLWLQIGYGLQQSSSYPSVIALGDGIIKTTPIITILIVLNVFSRSNGLFIMHFRWSQILVRRGTNNYLVTLCFILPLVILLTILDNLEEHNLSSSLGRLCFILVCISISIGSMSLKKSHIPLYINKGGKSNNFINNTIWNIIIVIPIIAAIASALGYLSTAKSILLHIEISNTIWLMILIVYHVIRRWMLIQHRRLSFDRAKQKRAEILALRARSDEEKEQSMQNADSIEIEEPVVNLDVISAQSLKLVRWILTLLALLLLIFSWSEIHLALGFFDNILLWNTTNSNHGNYHPITLGALLAAVLTFIITLQLVRNMPALIELVLLQHLNLRPGTNYTISTLIKYITIILGVLFGFSVIGIEWSKLQWLVAALGVGLGFGLQEIFANCISGLIILFERPIRIGDTVTIRDLTGSITRINTRATTITDWDRKEIIVPNKAFITEQFVNWSLSDSVTRVVIAIPTININNSYKVTKILKHVAECCSYVLKNPSPEVFLVDLQQGVMLFELRVYVAEMGHRMPLRHEINQLIIEKFTQNNITIPFPPFQMRIESVKEKHFTNKQINSKFFKFMN
ncbi:miniconductance mechanosensitive channel MscM [Candidatus Pantoea edessiphila]|uniref:Miniconductance mechanosensitive channel MscM n=1 Tax=Candidatus Pantoea edessiphila TaxID=2044610 RepID=A0A2P5SXP8_9GAMM|nr:miniconductance mechanosensitive channel MscM [Candidatus Pantoea edessiphila]MBK4775721.1 miniconductance mechanosensitive channel MscM [Pantoea sp. Edef]PPI87118.1 miniconductance mechanosensitive channel MscM [Candidatus Pantoea edessiphila]